VVEVPRPGGRIRKLAELSADDARAYEDAVAPLVPGIEASLGGAVLANRAEHPGPRGLVRLRDWRTARRPWGRGIGAAARAPATLVADVADCYASLRPPAVEGALRRLGADAGDASRVRRWLDAIREHGIEGLPVGPDASAILANAALASVDAALTAAGVPHLRWVDDFLVLAPSLRRAHGARDALLASLDRLGLVPNEDKTEILTDPREVGARLRTATSVLPRAMASAPRLEGNRVR
jgi:Reverse transcriptase (RNA-dependent DNA polymerase)